MNASSTPSRTRVFAGAMLFILGLALLLAGRFYLSLWWIPAGPFQISANVASSFGE